LLQYVDPDGKASVRLYGRSSLRIGRGTNNAVRLDDPGVELEHAVIAQDSAGYLLQDLSKLGGTWVNERRLRGDHRLANGDRITVATFGIEVDVIDTRSPLVLTITRLEQQLDESAVSAVRNLRELMARDAVEETSSFSQATMPMMLSRDLVALAEAERDRELAAGTAATATEPPVDETRAEKTAAGVSLPAVADTPDLTAPIIDYAASYRLQRGFLRAGVVAAALSLAAAGAIYSLVRADRWQAFSPGDLADAHRQIGDKCQACHAGWQPVEDGACSECHLNVGDHQTDQLAAPACVDCHNEHRGGDALRLAEEGSCVDCHGQLQEQVAGRRSVFVVRITEFAPKKHPEIRLTVAGKRIDLTDPAARSSDPGGIKGFDHDWHLNRLPAHVEKLDCGNCHRTDGAGEIVPILFENSCQECHNLAFDLRFDGEQAPHAEPTEVLTHLSGRYSLRPDFLRTLQGAERRRLGNRRLSEEQKLRELALLNTERLLRNRCLACHDFTPVLGSRMSRRESLRRSQIEELTVRDPAIRERWLAHADFAHGAHLELGMECRECHQGAVASKDTRDVLLPGIDVCFDCHRRAADGEVPEDRLGRTTCITCHGYHPGSGEENLASTALLRTDLPRTAGRAVR
ncbi:MAG: FHA domain-containing protein, partial [Thermoanaerobaculia bacterium]